MVEMCETRHPKGRLGRSIPVSDTAEVWLREAAALWGKDGFVLHAEEKPVRGDNWPDDVARACRLASKAETKRLGRPVTVRTPGVHGFRRAAGARWLAAGVPLHVVQKWLGHKDPRTTLDHYGGLAEATSMEAMARVNERAKLPRAKPKDPQTDASRSDEIRAHASAHADTQEV